MAKNGVTWQFTYDANGMRTGRTNGATTYRYIYNGSQLTQMHKGTDVLHFVYDAGGTQVALIYNGSVYYYLTSLQGDTFAIADSDGTIVVEYIYDAWGKILSITGSMASTLGVTNPLTYRGYVYDSETGLYYLQSRYYNPEWGRFLNADAFVSTGQGILGNNMFAYCLNNPVNGCDPCGTCFHNLKWYNCEKCAEFWNGVGQWCVDVYNKINSVYLQQTQLQTQITMQQNKMIADAAEATWDAYMWSYNQQQEAQLLEAQMTSAVSPRIIKAGWDAGCEAAIYAVAYNEFVRQTQNGDAKAVTTVVAFSFTAGFVAGSCMEIGRIIEEAIVFP